MLYAVTYRMLRQITYLFVFGAVKIDFEVVTLSDRLIISKKENMRGEDGYKVFSIRVKDETVTALDEIALKTERSRNELVNIFLEYAIKNVETDT